MPIEIKELHIKGVITNDSGSGNRPEDTHQSDEKQRTMIEACVEKVLQILEDKKQR